MSLQLNGTTNSGKLYLAIELSSKKWKLCFGTKNGSRKRLRTVDAMDLKALGDEIKLAKEKLSLSDNIRVISCYEAGRDGFWLHRYLEQNDIENKVVDSSSIEVNRKQRNCKTDRLDAQSLLRLLFRYDSGEKEVWVICHIPTEFEEDKRRVNRERDRLQKEKNAHSHRITSLLITQGIKLRNFTGFRGTLPRLRKFDGQPLAAELTAELLREYERYELANEQFKAPCINNVLK